MIKNIRVITDAINTNKLALNKAIIDVTMIHIF
jgi:hypothetical protein